MVKRCINYLSNYLQFSCVCSLHFLLTEFYNLSRSKTVVHVTMAMLTIISDVRSLHFLLVSYVETVMR